MILANGKPGLNWGTFGNFKMEAGIEASVFLRLLFLIISVFLQKLDKQSLKL